jgi:hypothetical protein
MRYRSWIRGLVAMVALAASVSGCATTVVGALRAPVSDCTSRCAVLTGDENHLRCLEHCPGARYSEAACRDDEPAEVACANDRRDNSADGLAAAGLALEIFGAIVDARSGSQSCHHYGH